jgi:hypothetical protein
MEAIPGTTLSTQKTSMLSATKTGLPDLARSVRSCDRLYRNGQSNRYALGGVHIQGDPSARLPIG